MFKKSATYICILLAGMTGLLGVNITNNGTIEGGVVNTYAADDCSGPNPPIPCLSAANKGQDAEMQKALQWFVQKLNIALNILTIIVSPSIVLASWLMSPDWTSGDLFQIRPMIHQLWIVVSNVTYFIYAILLIFIAMATIFNSDKYGYKQLLPKLALGIIMVPLSWWFIQFIISLSSLVTASVISMPAEVVINYNKNNADNWWTTPSIPKESTFNNQTPGPSKPCASKGGAAGPNEQQCITPEDFIKKGGGMYSSLMIYSFAVFKFQDVQLLNSNTQKVKAIGDIINQGLIGAIMFIVYGLLVMALIFMLFVRAIKLWFYAIFSPFMTLKFVLGDGMFKDKSNSFDLKEFIGLAFVPAIVGLALSFGLIIVSVMLKPPSAVTPGCTTTECKITLFGNDDSTIVTKSEDTSSGKIVKTTITTGGASYSYIGDVTSGNTTGNIMSALNMAGGILGTIIVDIIALMFIWVAFMAAKSVSKVAEAAFAPFEDIGNKMGNLAKSIPKYTPIPGTGGMSIGGLQKVPDLVTEGFRKRSDASFDASGVGRLSKKWADNASGAEVARYREAAMETGEKSAMIMADAIKKSIGNGNGQSIARDTQTKEAIETVIDKVAKGEISKDNLVHAGVDSMVARKMIEFSKTDEAKTEAGKAKFLAWMSGNKDTNLSGSAALDHLKDAKNATPGTTNTNLQFNITTDGSQKYRIMSSDIDTGATLKTKEEILNILKNNISRVAQYGDEVLKKELGKMGYGEESKESKELLEQLKKYRESQTGTTQSPASTQPQPPPAPKP